MYDFISLHPLQTSIDIGDTRYRLLHRTPNSTHHTSPYTHNHSSSSVCGHHTCVHNISCVLVVALCVTVHCTIQWKYVWNVKVRQA